MEIVRVTAHPLRAVLPSPQRTSQGDWTSIEIVVVEVETADGTVGLGECLARRGAVAYARVIEDVFAPLLIGESAFEIRFDVDREAPALLVPGTSVRFREVA